MYIAFELCLAWEVNVRELAGTTETVEKVHVWCFMHTHTWMYTLIHA